MAQRACARLTKEHISVLDPAAGSGILAAAAIDELLAREEPPFAISIMLCERDPRLHPALLRLAGKMRKAAGRRAVKINISIQIGDFLLSKIALERTQLFDLVIANPPYFKIGKACEQARAHAYAVHGQPNIYGLFMAATARLVAPSGRWCFITPRSWTNGPYFAAARRLLLASLEIEAIHVFESRRNHFADEAILQEAMITWAVAKPAQANTVALSASIGADDLAAAKIRAVRPEMVIDAGADRLVSIRLAEDGFEETLSDTLDSLGLKVSTGPVVAFRAVASLSDTRDTNTAPLLWMQHVTRSRVHWPIGKKREHIYCQQAIDWALVENVPMVLMRRFSPKEDVRRVTAAAYLGHLPGKKLGLENHLNYVYRPNGELSRLEALGLAAYLNSARVEAYLRAVAGNTQVNATELRRLPMPSISQLTAIGENFEAEMPLAKIDAAVELVIASFKNAA